MKTAFTLAALLLAANAGGQELVDQEQARIVTDQSRPEQCLSAVVIREIDGEGVAVSHRAFDLAPGLHRMNGMARLDTTHCPVADHGPGPGIPDLAAEFEAGKTYYVGLDHAAEDRGQWRLVIWRIEQGGVVIMQADEPAQAGDP